MTKTNSTLYSEQASEIIKQAHSELDFCNQFLDEFGLVAKASGVSANIIENRRQSISSILQGLSALLVDDKQRIIPFEFSGKQVRTLSLNGEPYFVAKDVAELLGYAKTRNAISAHCKGALKQGVPTNSGIQESLVIPERDVYRLIMKSKMPEAEKFEEWVVGEVLPSIRKTGSYATNSIKKEYDDSLERIDDFAQKFKKLFPIMKLRADHPEAFQLASTVIKQSGGLDLLLEDEPIGYVDVESHSLGDIEYKVVEFLASDVGLEYDEWSFADIVRGAFTVPVNKLTPIQIDKIEVALFKTGWQKRQINNYRDEGEAVKRWVYLRPDHFMLPN